MKKYLLFIAVFLGFCLTLGELPYVYAQEEYTLEEITITAQKRAENIQDSAISVVAISGDVLAEMGKADLQDTLLSAPGIIVQKYTRGYYVSMRGVSEDGPPSMSDITTAIYKDGVHDVRQEASRAGFYDINRVEALRGPQGTLYGRNATGGVVNIIYNDPKIQKYEATASLEMGNYSLLSTQAALNIPVGDSFAFRAAYSTIKRDGYIANGQDDNDTQSGRLKLKYAPNDYLSVLLGVEYTTFGGEGPGGVTWFAKDQPTHPWSNAWSSDNKLVNAANVKYWAQIDADFGPAVLTTISAFQRFHEDGYYYFTDPLQQQYRDNHNQVSDEIRLSSPEDSRTKWVAGLYYYFSDNPQMDLTTTIDQFGDTLSSTNYRKITYMAKSYAGFANITFPLSDVMRLTTGARVTSDNKKVNGIYEGTFAPSPIWNYDETWTFISYKVNLEYDINPESLLYGDISTGYRPGNLTFGTAMDPEYLTAFEIGSKNRFFDNTLQLNASAFYYDYKDYQALVPLFTPSGPTVTIYNGQGRSFGGEVETNWLASRSDMVNMAVAYLNAEFTDLVVGGKNYAGFKMNHSPELTVTASWEHVFALTNNGSLSFRADSRYESENCIDFSKTDDVQKDYVTQPAYHISGATIAYTNPNGKLKLSGYLKNFENYAVKTMAMGGGPPNLISSRQGMLIGAPRTWGVVLTINY